jgi:tripartite-type tricarboxylate transporter receptor subunit TctC
MTRYRPFLALVLGAVAVLAGVGPAAAQSEYPNRPVRVLVAFAPGGPADIIARVIGQKLSEAWKQPVVIENRPGAGGNLATQLVARATPDGYTALVSTSAFAVNPSLSRNAGYDPEKDLVPAVIVGASPNIFVVHPAVKAGTLKELIELARGGKLNYGSAGVGTTPHLSGEHVFKLLAKVNVVHVPYNGAGPALADVAGGHLEIASVALPPAVPMVQSGQVRAIAVTSAKRVAALPNVPTVIEAGYAGVEDYTWAAFFYPAAVPAAAIERMNRDVNQIIRQPGTVERLMQLGFEPTGGSPTQAADYVRAEIAKWGRIVKEVGIRVE